MWRIGDSPEAPKFNVVSTPNDWSRSVAATVSDTRLSEGKLRKIEYWDSLHAVLDAQNGRVRGNRKPQPEGWMSYSIGRTGFQLAAAMNTRERLLRAEIYIQGEQADQRLRGLEAQKDDIERELGYGLEWGSQKPDARDRRIACYLPDADPEDASDWPRQHEWLATRLNALYGVFVERVRTV